MGWRQAIRAVEAANRRSHRAALRRHRELERYERELAKEMARQAAIDAKEAERRRAANEVERYENYIELLLSVHKDCGDPWNWSAIASETPPSPPQRVVRRESAAAEALASYKPGLFDRWFGKAKKQSAILSAAVDAARAEDGHEFQQAVAQHERQCAQVNRRRQLAARVMREDLATYRDALAFASAYGEITDLGMSVEAVIVDPHLVDLKCKITDEEMVPTEEVKLTAAGKVSTKQMAAGKYWALYQDYVCACAIRLARETLAVLPVQRVIVNIGRSQVNSSTGHQEVVNLLSVHFNREKLDALNMEAIDPSDSMKNFPHRMKFKKTSGFEPVAPITADEQWVTT